MKTDKMNRRMFLQGVGGFTLGIPLLPSLIPNVASAQSVSPKRFIGLKSWSCQLHTRWYPARQTPGYRLRPNYSYNGTRSDRTVELNNVIPGTGFQKWAPLSDFANNGQGISDIIDNRFNSLLSKMMLIKGLDFHMNTNHNGGGWLGNFAACIGSAREDHNRPYAQQGDNKHRPTIDQIMAYSNNFYSQGLPPGGNRFLNLGCFRDGQVGYQCTWSNFGDPNRRTEPVPATVNPRTVFDQVFGTSNPSNTGGGQANPNVPLLNLVHEDFQRVRNGRRISSEDRNTLDTFMDRLTDLINSFGGSGGGQAGACSVPDRPRSINGSAYGPTNNEVAQAMTDIIIAAIQCGYTNIATLDVNSAWVRETSTGTPHIDVPGQWHASAHSWNQNMNAAPMLQLYRINKWIADTIFYRIVNGLNQTPDPNGGTILDNSLVYWGNELGFDHNPYSVPAITAGSAGGFFNTGNYYDYIHYDYPVGTFGFSGGFVVPGITHNRFLIAMLESMGVPRSEYERFNHGEAGYGSHSTRGFTAGVGQHASWNMSLNRSMPPGMVA